MKGDVFDPGMSTTGNWGPFWWYFWLACECWSFRFLPPSAVAMYSAPEDRPPLVPPTTYLLPPTTTCCSHHYPLPPRLPAASNDYPADSHDYLLPPTTTCWAPRPPTTFPQLPTTFPRLPAASHDTCLGHDYLPLPTTPALPRHLLPTKKWWYNSNGCEKRW